MSRQLVIDSLEFVRQAASQGTEMRGELPVSGMPRLVGNLYASTGVVQYSLGGRHGARSEPLLLLSIDVDLKLKCQRCLGEVDFSLSVDRVFELVEGGNVEEAALTLEELEDDARDLLPADRSMDVAELIEDEVILAIPISPKHERCELPEQSQDQQPDSPFSVLLKLRDNPKKVH